jgi:hypothetical protein
MQHRTPVRRRSLVAATAALSLLGLPLLTSSADAAGDPAPTVKVMTRNLYLGANIMRPIAALQQAQAEHPGDQLAQLNAFANANDTTHGIVGDTDYAARADLLAGEISSAMPDLVGLQEVALWRTGSMDSPLGPNFLARNATTVDPAGDFLAVLLAELAEDGVEYKAISVAKRADVEGPAYEGSFGSAQQQDTDRDVRLTMRDVIIVRVGSAVKYIKGTKGNETYDENLMFDLDNNPETDNAITFSRGFQWADMRSGDYRFRFLNTHFEAFGSDIAYAQAEQLIAGAAAYKGTAILSCDCNSDPLDGSVKPGETQPHWGPYYRLIRAGFNDTWLQWAPPQDGWTSGLSETVDDETAAGFDHRIDLILARTKDGGRLPVLSGEVVGNELTDRNEAGLWPSDHAGVLMKLRLR